MTGKILVVDPVATNRIVLKAKLSAAFYEADSAPSAAQALTAATAQAPDLVILSDRLPDGGAGLCSALRGAAPTEDIPILVLSEPEMPGDLAACLLAGADDAIDRGLGDAALFARLRTHLRQLSARRDLERRLGTSVYEQAARIPWAAGEAPGTIGWISENRAAALTWQAQFAAMGMARAQIVDPATVLGRAPAAPAPDLYVIDPHRGAPNAGLGLLSDLAARDHSRHAAVLVMQPERDGTGAAAAFDLGAAAVMQVALDPQELTARLTAALRRKRQSDRLRGALDAGLALAVKDPLTGLQNRRSALDALAMLARSDQTYALVMIDIDHFKSINDRFGHAGGDAALEAVAAQLRHSFAQAAVLGRIGGEEFLAALRITEPSQACALVEAARRDIAALHVPAPDGTVAISATISAGVVVCAPGEAAQEAMARADAALYAAKASGRNKVVFDERQPA